MVACSVKICKNRSENVKEKKIKFFSFPKNPEFASIWMKACDKEVNLKTVRSLLPDAVPTENLFNDRQVLKEINNNDPSVHVNINKNSRLIVSVTEYSSSTEIGGVDATIHNENNISTSNYGQEILSENLENEIPLPRITENAIPTIEKLNGNITENEKYESAILQLKEQLARERKQNQFLKKKYKATTKRKQNYCGEESS